MKKKRFRTLGLKSSHDSNADVNAEQNGGRDTSRVTSGVRGRLSSPSATKKKGPDNHSKIPPFSTVLLHGPHTPAPYLVEIETTAKLFGGGGHIKSL
jgi:hypothetical protein